LGIELYDGPAIADQDLDVLIIINGSTLYCKHLPEIAKAVVKAKEVVWVQNDYTLPPPKAISDAESPFRRAFADRALVPHYWSTCGGNAKMTPHSAQVNWNVLGMDYTVPQARLEDDTWLYYGAYRESRVTAFDYLDRKLAAWTVSSTSAKFDQHPHAHRVAPMSRADFFPEISKYGMGIYAQDVKSAKQDHCPATRFYEMLSAGLPMTFLPDCVGTLKQYGIDCAPYVVHEGLMLDRERIAQEQRTLWYKDYTAPLAVQVRQLARGLGL